LLDWNEIRGLIKQAVADAYAEASDDEIFEHVAFSIMEARAGLISQSDWAKVA
jgi:hypothetical protein